MSIGRGREETVKAIFLTYIIVLSTLPFIVGMVGGYVLGGWKVSAGIFVWLIGMYMMLIGMYIIVRKWIRRRNTSE